MHGVFQIVEKAFGWNKKETKGSVKALRILVTFTIVTIAWVVFRSPSIGDACGLMGRYFTNSGKLIADVECLIYCAIALVPLVSLELITEYWPSLKYRLQSNQFIRWTAYIVVFVMIVFVGVHDGSSFIYVSF